MISEELYYEINRYLEKKLDKILNEDSTVADKKNKLWFTVQCIIYAVHNEESIKLVEPDEHS